jgi:PAS domain S-box-containing protein
MADTPQPPEPDDGSKALREEQEVFRLIAESARDFAIFTTDLDRVVTTWNKGAERLIGHAEADILGRSADVIYVPEDRAAGVPEREATQALARGRAEDDRWHLRRDGGRFWGSGLMMPLRDDEGRVRGLVKILRDLTERRDARTRLAIAVRDLEESELRHRLLISEIKDYGIFMLDPDGRVMTWNTGAERLMGYEAEEIIGQHISRFFTEEDILAGKPEQELRTARAEGRNEAEGWRVRKDGSLFWGNEIMSAVRDPDGSLRGFAKIVRDLTERKRAEDEVRRTRDELEVRVRERTAELSRALESLEREGQERRRTEQDRLDLLRRLVAVQEDERRRISRELHDEMGQHLAAMAVELKLVRESLSDQAARHRLGQLQALTSQVGREVHRLALELRPSALDDLGLEKALENFLDEWSERSRIEVEYHCGLGAERPSPQIETTLYRIVQESLTNVLKHSGARRVGVILERNDGQLRLIVEDDGRGFDAEAMTAPSGVGGRLGLLGMKERVAMVGGSLNIESSPGSATTVFVRVPMFEPGASRDA